MPDFLIEANRAANAFVWGIPAMIALFLLSGRLVAICRERKDGVPANGSPKC